MKGMIKSILPRKWDTRGGFKETYSLTLLNGFTQYLKDKNPCFFVMFASLPESSFFHSGSPWMIIPIIVIMAICLHLRNSKNSQEEIYKVVEGNMNRIKFILEETKKIYE